MQRQSIATPRSHWRAAAINSSELGIMVLPFIVVGGGFSGLAIARELARRGQSVILLERSSELAGGSSAASLRIVHGGFRYLAAGRIPAAWESIRARSLFHKFFPEVVRPLRCGVEISGLQVVGAKLLVPTYRHLAAKTGVGADAEVVSVRALEGHLHELVPYCHSGVLSRALIWEDSLLIDPAAFASSLAKDCSACGVEIRPGTTVTQISMAGADSAERKVEVVTIGADRDSKKVLEAGRVINATGHELSQMAVVATTPPLRRSVTPVARAWNVIVKQKIVEYDDHAFGVPLLDGRLVFCCKRGEGTAIGTCYDRGECYSGDSGSGRPDTPGSKSSVAKPSVAAILAFLRQVEVALKGRWRFSLADVISLDVGAVPVKRWKPAEKADRDAISRASSPVFVGRERISHCGLYTEVCATKFTTCLTQAERVCDSLGIGSD